MNYFIIGLVVFSIFPSFLVVQLLKKSPWTYALALLLPSLLFALYMFLSQDEFGYWTIYLSLGLCLTLPSSALGLALNRLLINLKSA